MSISWPALLVICGTLLAVVLALFWHAKLSRTKSSSSDDRGSTAVVLRDHEQYWSAGFLYDNPDDPALFVPKRFGLGYTVNIGHPLGKLVLIGMLLLPVGAVLLKALSHQ